MAIKASPDEKRLRHVPFVIHATRGLIRDQRTRRGVMLGVLVAALLLMVCGSTFLQPALNPHERPGLFILFWLVCAWLTLTAILLAFFDLLMLRTAGQKAQRDLLKDMEGESSRGSQPKSSDENREL
jgi:hypothetical protein